MISIEKTHRGISKKSNTWVYGMPISENLLVPCGKYGVADKEQIVEIYPETLQKKCEDIAEDIFEGDKLVAENAQGFKIYASVFLAKSYIQDGNDGKLQFINYVRVSEVRRSDGTIIFKDKEGDMFIPMSEFLRGQKIKIVGTVWDDYLEKAN